MIRELSMVATLVAALGMPLAASASFMDDLPDASAGETNRVPSVQRGLLAPASRSAGTVRRLVPGEERVQERLRAQQARL